MSWFMYVAFFWITLIIQAHTVTCKGSTVHLKDIVLGRCWYHKQFKKDERSINCTTLWEAFQAGFAYKDPCKLTFNDYKPFFDQLIDREDVVDKSLFWSGTYKAVHSYSDFDLRFTTLEDTLEGYMMNELSWCGNLSLSRNTSDGIDYNFCPNSSSNCDRFTPFWGQASKKFAERARGVVRVMVNGSRVSGGVAIPAYSRSSFFGKYELPNFKVPSISRLEVLVVHTIGTNEREKCHTNSIKLLEQDAKSRGLTVLCYDDPDDVQHILCADHPDAKRCIFQGPLRNRKDYSQWKTIAIVLAVTSLVLFIVAVTMAAICCKRSFRKHADDTVVLT